MFLFHKDTTNGMKCHRRAPWAVSFSIRATLYLNLWPRRDHSDLHFNNELSNSLTWRWSVSSSRCPSHPLVSPPQCSQWGPRCTACRWPASWQSPGSRRWPGHRVYVKLPWWRVISCLVVEPKYCVVYAYLVKLDQTLHWPEYIQHDPVTS